MIVLLALLAFLVQTCRVGRSINQRGNIPVSLVEEGREEKSHQQSRRSNIMRRQRSSDERCDNFHPNICCDAAGKRCAVVNDRTFLSHPITLPIYDFHSLAAIIESSLPSHCLPSPCLNQCNRRVWCWS